MNARIMRMCFLVLALFVLCAAPLAAHELIPKEVEQFLASHPNATPEELTAFMQSQSPEVQEKYRTKESAVSLIRDRSTSFLDTVLDFIKLGVGHILEGPDHILFVLSLLLVFLSFTEILKYTAVFTVAHSITLLLAGSGVLVLSPRLVEPVIALSIAYMAFTTVFLQHTKFFGELHGKLTTIFAFGLFHGLGFAGLLQEIQIPDTAFLASLLSFNVGIEIGQLCIVALALPVIYFAREREWYPRAVQVAAVGIIITGLVWSIERLVFA